MLTFEHETIFNIVGEGLPLFGALANDVTNSTDSTYAESDKVIFL